MFKIFTCIVILKVILVWRTKKKLNKSEKLILNKPIADNIKNFEFEQVILIIINLTFFNLITFIWKIKTSLAQNTKVDPWNSFLVFVKLIKNIIITLILLLPTKLRQFIKFWWLNREETRVWKKYLIFLCKQNPINKIIITKKKITAL